MKGAKLNNSEAIHFILAGNATFTFLNTKTGNRFTFRLRKAKCEKEIYYVSVLTSPDVYTYLGTFINNIYNHSNKSHISVESQSVKVFKYVIYNLIAGKLPDFIEIWHEGKCGKCGRTLTVPSSIETGLGPECVKKMNKRESREKIINLVLSYAQ